MDPIDQERAKQAADSERELTRLWRAWRTIHEMCFDRVCAHPLKLSKFSILTCSYQGYELSEEELHISLDEFREKFSDANGAPEYNTYATTALQSAQLTPFSLQP